MNPKLSGVIFFIFGLSLTGDSAYELFNGSDRHVMYSILLLLLGVASCIYGIKQFRNKPRDPRSFGNKMKERADG